MNFLLRGVEVKRTTICIEVIHHRPSAPAATSGIFLCGTGGESVTFGSQWQLFLRRRASVSHSGYCTALSSFLQTSVVT